MAPPSNPNPAPLPRRLSCDRCHYQKLRCTRAGDNPTDPCNRCLRQNAQCVYSSSLPKGRPSMYRQSKDRRPPASPRRATIDSTTSHANSDISRTSNSDGSSSTASHTQREDSNPNGDIDQLLAGTIDPSSTPGAWPWMAPIEWNEMQIDSGDSEFMNMINPGSSDGQGLPCSPPSVCVPEFETPMFELFQNATSIAKSDPDLGIAQLSQLSTRLYPLHRSSCSLAETAGLSGKQSPELGQHKPQPLVDDMAFNAVAKWLVHGVSTNMDILFRADHRLHNPNINPALRETPAADTLHDTFAASHHLLEILRLLQSNVTGGFSSDTAGTTSARDPTDFWRSVTPQSDNTTTGSNESSIDKETATSVPSASYGHSSSGGYSSTVVRHLVIACHTLLLNIYIAVLIALQHDVDLRNSCASLPGTESTCADATALADMRLVLIVQLCSYLIKRQHQAVDAYLSPNPQQQQQQPVEPCSPTSTATSASGSSKEISSDLEMEVQHRLLKLRQTLRI
ncbi:hypothetical protein QBC40DRAFT_227822 [Triangularia verruculosa]|uniref:Zn(2)-C6 fungal-type domain-containing protein n=1 Tax=Triangularia verruculosa TaxID=2587418 RepID=A0AAN6XH98_9PEZI|nr:hypothetical protein QBC40DRAFT_227822 [Triangularia verruculosa]